MAGPPRQKKPRSPGATAGYRISDPRFSNIQTDPQFRLPSRKNTHIQIDKRFSRMLHDDGFSSRAKVDRYGRKLPKDAGKRELEKYYRIEDDEKRDSEDESDNDASIEQELDRINAEDEQLSSSDDSSSSDEETEDRPEQEVFGLLNDQEGEEGIPKGEVSPRIAVVNLDWDNIRAADLMAVFSSFVPSSGRIRKISIYPSQFGKERMQREELDGPPKDVFGAGKQEHDQEHRRSDYSSSEEEEGDQVDKDGDEDEQIKKSILKEDQGQEFNSARLRRYQLERLRYYYAVLECSSKSTAQAIYEAVDGTEYLTTANFFDLRYIPDEVDFSEDEARDECKRIPDKYRPNEFVTDALQHSKVRLTWDADDGSRKEAQKRAFAGSRADIDENDLKAYLGSGSSDDEGREEPVVVDATADTPNQAIDSVQGSATTLPKLSKKEAERQRMRALLGLEPGPTRKKKAEKDAPVGDMQVTFSSGLSSDMQKSSVFENEPERDETTAEKYIRKEKERKARRKEKMKNIRSGNEPTEETLRQHPQSDNGIDKPSNDLGFSDPFFDDPSHSKRATTAQRKAEKQQKREERAAEEAAAATERAKLELLMADDKTQTNDMHHFDINDLVKAEKTLSRKSKLKGKKKLSEREARALEAKQKDQFKIDVGDERFRDVFEKSEFAIDPSHPRFKGTEGMRKILEEGRRKRKVGSEDGGDGEGRRGKRRKEGVEVGGGEADVERLLERVRGKTGKRRRMDEV